MSYIDGFRDATELFETSVNKSVTRGIKSKEDMISAFDSIIATIYIAKLSLSKIEDDYLEGMLDEMSSCEDDCETCDIGKEMDINIGRLLNDIFSNAKEGK